MFNDEKDLFKSINELWDLLEKITEKEVDMEIINGNLSIIITNKNKQVMNIPNPGDVKELQDLDELRDLYEFTSSLPEDVRE